MKVSRQEVFAALNSERAYQDSLPPSRSDGQPRSVGDYVAMLVSYVHKAVTAWTDSPGDAHALEVVRKVGGIAVHCMEDHGAPQRAGYEQPVNAPPPPPLPAGIPSPATLLAAIACHGVFRISTQSLRAVNPHRLEIEYTDEGVLLRYQ